MYSLELLAVGTPFGAAHNNIDQECVIGNGVIRMGPDKFRIINGVYVLPCETSKEEQNGASFSFVELSNME